MRLCMTELFHVGNIILLFTELIKVEFKFEVLCIRLCISVVPKLGVGPPPQRHKANLRGHEMVKNDHKPKRLEIGSIFNDALYFYNICFCTQNL